MVGLPNQITMHQTANAAFAQIKPDFFYYSQRHLLTNFVHISGSAVHNAWVKLLVANECNEEL